jgi:hypothetical protein
VWGVATQKDDIVHVVSFKETVRNAKLSCFRMRQFKLHLILVSDIDVVHTVLGIQTYAVTNPCYKCDIEKKQVLYHANVIEKARPII